MFSKLFHVVFHGDFDVFPRLSGAPGDPREGHGGARTAQGHGRAEADLSHSRLGVESGRGIGRWL